MSALIALAVIIALFTGRLWREVRVLDRLLHDEFCDWLATGDRTRHIAECQARERLSVTPAPPMIWIFADDAEHEAQAARLTPKGQG